MSPRARILRRRDFLALVATSGLAAACRKHDGEWQDEAGMWHSEPHQVSDPVPPPCQLTEVRLLARWDAEVLRLEAIDATLELDRGRRAQDAEWFLFPADLTSPLRVVVGPRGCREPFAVVLPLEQLPPRGAGEREIVLRK